MYIVRRAIRERLLFLRSFLAHPRQVGAILPTSRRAVRDMLDMATFTGVECVVELGAGTGVYTREVLARLPKDARFLAFEIDSNLAATLRTQFQDPRLQVVQDSAENVRAYLNGTRADVIVSGLPFTSLPVPMREAILQQARDALAPTGVMLVLQYSPLIQRELRRRFGFVRRRVSLLNVPPAFLFACRAAKAEGNQ